jgi:hypothetical protein
MLVPAILGIVYIVSSAGETIVIKALNYASPPLALATYTGFMSNQVWILMLPVYAWMRWTLGKPYKMKFWKEYIGFGLVTFFATLFRNLSLTVMPGSVFGLLISTSIVFNMILSYFWLKKEFNRWHVAAAVTCLLSAVSIAISAFITEQEATTGANYAVGVPMAISGAFCVAFLTVWQEEFQPRLDDLNLRLVELILSASLISAILMIATATFTLEIQSWAPSISATANTSLVLVVGCSVALPILKLLVRNTKYSIIQLSNAFFFEFLQSTAALVGSFANILLFNEPWGPGYIVAFILLAASFGLYARAKYVAATATRLPSVMPPPPPYVNPLVVIPVSAWK